MALAFCLNDAFPIWIDIKPVFSIVYSSATVMEFRGSEVNYRYDYVAVHINESILYSILKSGKSWSIDCNHGSSISEISDFAIYVISKLLI